MDNPKIDFVWNSAIVEIHGDAQAGGVTGATLRDVNTGAESKVATDGVFMAIGHVPNAKVFEGQLEQDAYGYLVTKKSSTETNVPGVFACGDVQDRTYRQAITAAGTGCMAAIDAERFLEAEPAKSSTSRRPGPTDPTRATSAGPPAGRRSSQGCELFAPAR